MSGKAAGARGQRAGGLAAGAEPDGAAWVPDRQEFQGHGEPVQDPGRVLPGGCDLGAQPGGLGRNRGAARPQGTVSAGWHSGGPGGQRSAAWQAFPWARAWGAQLAGRLPDPGGRL
jgi:hypothetical protein